MARYQGISYPERAEYLQQQMYDSYRVFLNYWDPLSHRLRLRYEQVAVSRRAAAVVVYGPQGSGKTLFADKLKQGLDRARDGLDGPSEPSNLWHRITGGSTLDAELIRDATRSTTLRHIEDDRKWVENTEKWIGERQPHENCIVVADNAERGYFLQGLLGLDNAEFMQLGRTDEAQRMAAERFVALARTRLRPALFIILTNNEPFATEFWSNVDSQHHGLLTYELLPLPPDQDKETVVRVNTNLLNEVTYWYCLDKAGPAGKESVYAAVRGNETFPGVFGAVNEALSQSDRVGRPANKCLLSLFVFTNADDVPPEAGRLEASIWDERSWGCDDLQLRTYTSNWALPYFPGDPRRARMLESEWNLRVIVAGNRILSSLLNEDHREQVGDLISMLSTTHGVGTHKPTMSAYWEDLVHLIRRTFNVTDAPDVQAFWAKGQGRSADYESALSAMYGDYNKAAPGFLNYRPDLVVEPYAVCSALGSSDGTSDSINVAIRRKTHVFEFTALQEASPSAIHQYLRGKVENYASILEQQ